MATTYNFTDGSISGQTVPRVKTAEENEIFFLRNIADFSLQTLTQSTADIAQVINVPAGTTVITAWIRVITADGDAATIDLGYGGNPDQWLDNGAANSAAGTLLGYLWVPQYFASADTIDITVKETADLDEMKCEVVAMCMKQLGSF